MPISALERLRQLKAQPNITTSTPSGKSALDRLRELKSGQSQTPPTQQPQAPVTPPAYLQQPAPVAPQGSFRSVQQQNNIFTAPLQKAAPSYPGISEQDRARMEASKPTPFQEKVGDVISTGVDIGKNVAKSLVDTASRAVAAKVTGGRQNFLPETVSVANIAKDIALKFGADPRTVEENLKQLPEITKQDISLRYSDDPIKAISETVNDAVNVYSGGAGQVFKGVTRPILRKFLTSLGMSAEGAIISGAATAGEEIRQGKSVTEAVKSGFEAAPYGAAFGTVLSLPGLKSTAAQKEADALAKVVKKEEKAGKTTGEIIQGAREDIPRAQKTLVNIDTKGVKTYQDLSNKVDTFVNNLVEEQDKVFAKDATKRPVSDYSKTYKSGEQSVTVNSVNDALDHLEEFYTVTNQPQELVRVKALKDSAIKDGLTVREVNQIAREYGTEFGSKAFSQRTGEALTSVNAQKFENTRKAVKDAAREFSPTNETSILDEKISNALRTKSLIDDMAEKVNALEQKIKKRGLLERIARSVGRTIDILSFGSIRGFLTSFIPSNIGNKVMNSIDLEKVLSKNLKKLEVLLPQIDSLTDEQVISKVGQILRNEKAPSQLLLPAPKQGAQKFGGGAIPESGDVISLPPVKKTQFEPPARKIGNQPSEMQPGVVKKAMDAKELAQYEQSVIEGVRKGTPIEFVGQMENQYQKFVDVLKNKKVAFKKEAIQSGDIESITSALKNIMPESDIQKMFYSQDMNGDEMLELFRSRLQRENPGLLNGQKVSENLGFKRVIPPSSELFAMAPTGIRFEKDENGNTKLVYDPAQALALSGAVLGISKFRGKAGITPKTINTVSRNLIKEDITLMESFIDAVRLRQKPSPDLQAEARKMIEALGGNQEISNSKVADIFDEILSTTRQSDKKVSLDLAEEAAKNRFTTKKLPAPKKISLPVSKESKPLYHGTSEADLTKLKTGSEGNLGKGIYITDHPDAAKFYGKQAQESKMLRSGNFTGKTPDGYVLNVEIKKGANIKQLDYQPTYSEAQKLREQGYDGISYPDQSLQKVEGRPGIPKDSRATVIYNEDVVSVKQNIENKNIAFHGTQSKVIEGVPRKSNGTMGNAFYLSDSQKIAENFGRDQNVKIKDSTRLLRRSGVYPSASVHSFDLSDLKIKEFKNDTEFFDFAKEADFDRWFRLAGYDGAFIKNRNAYAIYSPEKLKLKRSKRTLGKKYN